MKKLLMLVLAAAGCVFAGNSANPDAVELQPIPVPVEFKSDMDRLVAFDAGTTVTVECPDKDACEWLAHHFGEWFGKNSPKIVQGTPCLTIAEGQEAYAVRADETGVKIAARSLAGARWAAYTVRQIAVAKRGTFKTEGYVLPTLAISDKPKLAFRAIHFCWFPETPAKQIERAIRLAALCKFNYAIIEPWGMYESEKHPWWHWPNPAMTKKEVRKLVALGRDLGITLIPQINCYGHATASRGGTIKHAILDIHPEYAPLFEPGGWNWCLSNPETQRVLRELITEMHEDFGNPAFFHLGCDEAQPPSCPECRKTPYGELVCKHIAGLAGFLKTRGARAMIWHDMLIKRGDPRWKGFKACGSESTSKLPEMLPKDVVICDWQYEENKEGKWPTINYFKEKGFDVAGCPWMNYTSMKSMADCIAANGGFGIIETTWHRLRGKEWSQMYKYSSAAAWGGGVPKRTPMYDTSFAIALRLVGEDMKTTDYRDAGHLNNQIPPGWWAN